jgi:hypothetical protein
MSAFLSPCADARQEAAVSAKVLGPRQGRFRFGHETAHDLRHRQDFFDSARGLPG